MPGVARVSRRPLTPEFPLDSCSARGRRRPPHCSRVPWLVTSCLPGIVSVGERSIALRFLWCPSLVCPPSPFPSTTVLVPIPSRPTGEYFCGLPARPLPVGSPCPRTLRPPNRCHGPLPFPPSPFLRHARGSLAPSPKQAFSSDPMSRSNPAQRARARP